MQKLKDMKIKKRLNTGFKMVTGIATIAAVLGIIAMLVASGRYEYAMTNYGFSQGDIGKAMVTFSETRSALRAVVGYDEEDMIEAQVSLHDQKKEAFETYLKDIESTMVFPQAKEAYNTLVTDLDGYWDIDAEVLELATSSSDDGYLKAQEIDTGELSPQYDKIYQDLATLMDLNVQKGDASKASLHNMELIFMIVIIAVIVVCIVISIRIGNTMAVDIEKPLTALAERLKSFAEGDLDSPFPESEADDEIKEMILEAEQMAHNLNLIITDAGELLGEMAAGNYAVGTRIEDKYVGKFVALKDAMRKMNRQMNSTLQQVEDASKQVSAGSENLAESAQALAEGATDQAGSVEELTATITNITDNVNATAEKLEASHQKASQYAKQADNSREQMTALTDAMGRINETSTKIENIISDIEDIASQTNLLSLNAAIEAARAGEARKGFAVVADEIRVLAEQSKAAVAHIQEVTGNVTAAVENLANDAERLLEFVGNDVVESLGGFAEMANSYNSDAANVDSLVTDFSASSEQLLASINGVMDAISDVSKTATEGATGTTDIAEKVGIVVQEAEAIKQKAETTYRSAEKLQKNVERFIV